MRDSLNEPLGTMEPCTPGSNVGIKDKRVSGKETGIAKKSLHVGDNCV